MKHITYKKGYKYQLNEKYSVETNISPEIDIQSESNYIHLSKEGIITIEKGYAWDGPSGPTFDTKNFMRGSLVHDALYQMMRAEEIPQTYRLQADKLLRHMCKQDGMSGIRAWWVFKGVSWFAKSASSAKNQKQREYAPKYFDEETIT